MSFDRKLTRRSALHGTVAVTIAQILAACGSDGEGSLGTGAGTGGAWRPRRARWCSRPRG